MTELWSLLYKKHVQAFQYSLAVLYWRAISLLRPIQLELLKWIIFTWMFFCWWCCKEETKLIRKQSIFSELGNYYRLLITCNGRSWKSGCLRQKMFSFHREVFPEWIGTILLREASIPRNSRSWNTAGKMNSFFPFWLFQLSPGNPVRVRPVLTICSWDCTRSMLVCQQITG